MPRYSFRAYLRLVNCITYKQMESKTIVLWANWYIHTSCIFILSVEYSFFYKLLWKKFYCVLQCDEYQLAMPHLKLKCAVKLTHDS